MLFMIIERIKDQDASVVYARLRDQGRMMPEGLEYIDSWVEPNFDRVFQLMSTDSAASLQEWMLSWGDLLEFEIVPVVPSKETIGAVSPHLDQRKDSNG